MDELPLHSPKRFRGAAGDALRVRFGNEMGDYSKTAFARMVAAQSPWAENTIMGYLKGTRRPTPSALEAMAEVLDLPARGAYFFEYRMHQLEEICWKHPELERRFYDLVLAAAAELQQKAQEAGVSTEGAGQGAARRTARGQAQEHKSGQDSKTTKATTHLPSSQELATGDVS